NAMQCDMQCNAICDMRYAMRCDMRCDAMCTRGARLTRADSEINTLQRLERPSDQETARLRDVEGRCRSYLRFADETLTMLCYMSKAIQRPFLAPEIVDRLAAMLNYNLDQLAGPKCVDLKVKDPQRCVARAALRH